MADLTTTQFETDWGAEGSQWTGKQVQEFIKNQFISLINKNNELQAALTSLQSNYTSLSSTVNSTQELANNVNSRMDTLSGGINATLTATSNLEQEVENITRNCFIFYKASNDQPRFVTREEWLKSEINNGVADGVIVFAPGREPLIVGLQEGLTSWASSSAQGNTTYDTAVPALKDAMVDFNGIKHTQMASSTAQSNTSFRYCLNYSTEGIGTNKWWLPSLGELAIIWQNRKEINRCLRVISGAAPLYEGVIATRYQSSTEASASTYWAFGFGQASVYAAQKYQGGNTYKTRPVTGLSALA